ncbi:MAG: hypothetical protein QJR08_00255 [Bacillota bacterium]|nr:hypothetical protein [Bacillota bacterium]
MRATVKRSDLEKAAAGALRAVAAKPPVPVLAFLRIEAGDGRIEVAGSSLEATVRLAAPADVEEGGAALVPARLFAELLRLAGSDEIRLGPAPGGVELSWPGGRHALRGPDPAEWPEGLDQAPAAGDAAAVPARALASGIRLVAPAALGDLSRPPLHGVRVRVADGELELLALDGIRVSRFRADGAGGGPLEAIVPAAWAKLLADLLAGAGEDEEVWLEPRGGAGGMLAAMLPGGGLCMLECLDGRLPDVGAILPRDYPIQAGVDASALVAAAERLALAGLPIGMGIGDGRIRLATVADGSADPADLASEELEADTAGDGEAAFDPRFFLQAVRLAAGAGGEISVELSGPLSAAMITGMGAPGFEHWLMPMRIGPAAAQAEPAAAAAPVA